MLGSLKLYPCMLHVHALIFLLQALHTLGKKLVLLSKSSINLVNIHVFNELSSTPLLIKLMITGVGQFRDLWFYRDSKRVVDDILFF